MPATAQPGQHCQWDWLVSVFSLGTFIDGIRVGGANCQDDISATYPDSLGQTYAFDVPITFGAPQQIGGYLNARTIAESRTSGSVNTRVDVTATWEGIEVYDHLGVMLVPGVHYTLTSDSAALFGVDWMQPVTLSPPAPAECNDLFDNDADGSIDFPNDSECDSSHDTTEAPEPSFTAALSAATVLIGQLARRRRKGQLGSNY